MHRWTSLLVAMMLVLMLWTGSAAHAAEPFNCTAPAQAAGSPDWAQDQVPSSPDQCAVHNHSGCSGHNAEAAPNAAAIEPVLPPNLVLFAWRESGRPGRAPDSDLRPPIA